MIAKGNLHSHGQKLAAYLITGKEDERAELVELKGFASPDIREAFIDVMIQSEATRCERPFFHAHVRLPEGEALRREQWLCVADRIEQQLGFEGQGRAVSFHQQPNGDRHLHVAWSRIDLEQMKAIDPGLYKNQLKEICRGLEKELGLTRVRNERDPEHKTLAAGRNEFEQSRRLGTDLRTIRETIRACWEQSDNGHSFEAALAEHGCVLARGDRRDFVVIDPAGGDHALGKRIVGVAAPEIRTRLADIDKQQLPSVDQAKTQQAERDRTAPDRAPPQVTIETPARVAPEPAQAHDQREATAATQEQQAASASPARDAAGLRKPDDIASRVASGIMSAFAAVLDALANMISPPPPPTPEQQKLDIQAAEERSVQLVDERKGEEDLRLRLEQQIKDDLARGQKEHDEDHYRGRERER